MNERRKAFTAGKAKTAIVLMASAAMLTLAGCRSSRHAATGERPAATGTDTTETVETPKTERTVTNFDATFEGVSLNGQLRIVEDSALWVSISKLVEVGRGLATQDSVWISAPLMDVYFAGTYTDLSRKAGRTLTFDKLQQMALSDNAEQELRRLAAALGFDATVRITSRRKVDRLSLPYRKK